MNFCTKCGNKLSENDLFCSGCGTKIVRNQEKEAPAAQAAEEQAEIQQPATEPEIQTMADQASVAPSQENQQPATETEIQAPADQASEEQPPGDQQPATESEIQAATTQASEEQAEIQQPVAEAEAQGTAGQVSEEKPQNQQPVTEAEIQVSASATKATDPLVTKPKRKNIKLWLIPTAIVVGILLIGYAIYSYLDHKTSLNNTILQFEQAVINEDIPLLLTLLESGHEDMELDEKSVKQFVEFLNDDPSVMDNIMDYLFIQMDSGRTRADAVVSVHTSGKQYLLFDRYVFQVKPMYVNFVSNYANTDYYLGDKKVATSKEADEEVIAGPFLPGKYEFKAKHEGEYVVLEQKKTETLYYSPTQFISFWFEGDYVYLYAYQDNVNIILNGEDIGVKVSDLDLGKFGPLLLDGSTTIAIEYEYPWGKERSEELTLEAEHKNSTITDILNENKNYQTREDIMTAINEFSLSWTDAISKYDANLIKHISDENRSSIAMEFDTISMSGLEITSRLIRNVYNLDSFYFSEYNNEYTAEIQVETTMTHTYRIAGELPHTEEQVSIFTYSLTYDVELGEWIITHEWENFSFNATNTEEFRF